MYCGNCGKEIDDGAVTCPMCGAPTGVNAEPRKEEKKEAAAAPQRQKAREKQSKQMAEIGISIAFLAALIYWSGLITAFPVIPVLLAGYVLIREKDQWLRAVALKAVTIMVIFGLLLGFVNLLVYFKEAMVDIINMLLTTISPDASRTVSGAFFTDILDILTFLILFIRDLFLILSGFKALKYRNMRIPVIDDLVNRHIGRVTGPGR